MNEYETTTEFFGEERPVLVTYGYAKWDEWEYIEKVEVELIVKNDWTPTGEFKPHVERRVLDVTPILSAEQAWELVKEIRADRTAKAGEDYDDGRMMDAEERWRRIYGRRLAA